MKKKNLISIISVIVWFISVTIFNVNASWQGSTEIIARSWGKNPGQFGIEYGDTADRFPQSFGVTNSGKIAIADPINEVLHTFNSDGSFLRDIKRNTSWEGWPYTVIVNGECAVVGYVEFTDTFSISTGDLIGSANNMGGADYISADCTKIYVGGKSSKVYSPTGQLIKTFTERPLELGKIIEEKRLADKSYNIRMQYPEGIYAINVPRKKPDGVSRDAAGNLYVSQRLVDVIKAATDESGEETVAHNRVIRYSFCGKETGRLDLPQDQYEIIGRDDVVGIRERVLAEYGAPVIAPNGDVYTWKRTPDKYSILKWQWQDDPNVPTGPDAPADPKVIPSTSGLYLTWTASPQDPGCVTGYEIARATTAGGMYSTLTTTDKGVLKYNDTTAEAGTSYFYKVRAMAGSYPSVYTGEVSGKR